MDGLTPKNLTILLLLPLNNYTEKNISKINDLDRRKKYVQLLCDKVVISRLLKELNFSA